MIMGLSLQNLPNADQKLEAMFHAFDDLLFILDIDGTILDYKAGNMTQLYVPASEFLRQKMQDVLPASVGKKFSNALHDLRQENKIILIEYSLPVFEGEHWFESRLTSLSNGQVIVFVRDITKYKNSEVKIKNQLDQLAALRSIDLAITSGSDLNLTLAVILDHVRKQLNIDAASVLLLNARSQRLEFAAEMGFRTPALQYTRLRIGEGHAGNAALERKVLHIPDLKNLKTGLLRSPFFSEENFLEYYAVPLIAKGEILGVLEIFHRTSIQANSDWINFMNMLAGQAAIAIDNAMLFKNLESTNIELTMAYDKTIEGWARALHLRDKETEIHTRRVTELTLRLARQIGIPETDFIHLRRGAILHDIGKVAIPDSILLKPGALDEDEWKLMRQHPRIAFELLQPVPFLAPALTIPRSHHEKWDGSGYPDGLAGDQIPIAARIFAVVDVYDALTSDRPYRSAWSKEQAIEHINSQIGKHFDPNIIPGFIEMIHGRETPDVQETIQ